MPTAVGTDRHDVGLARRGDRRAQRRLWERHAPWLYAVALRYMSERADADDVLQEAFVKVFAALGRYEWRGDTQWRAWLRRVVVNEALHALRSRRRGVPIDEAADIAADEADAPPGGVPPDVLHDMVRRLPDGYRTVLNLYAFEGLSHKAIGNLLGISELTSASQLSRAKLRLRVMITDYLHHHEQ